VKFHLERLGEGGQLREPSDDKRSFFCPAPSRVKIYCESVADSACAHAPMTCPLHFQNYGRRFAQVSEDGVTKSGLATQLSPHRSRNSAVP
jgi:hypothetical protein